MDVEQERSAHLPALRSANSGSANTGQCDQAKNDIGQHERPSHLADDSFPLRRIEQRAQIVHKSLLKSADANGGGQDIGGDDCHPPVSCNATSTVRLPVLGEEDRWILSQLFSFERASLHRLLQCATPAKSSGSAKLHNHLPSSSRQLFRSIEILLGE